MNKLILLTLIIFSCMLISATPLEELSNELDLDILITNNYTEINANLDSEGLNCDVQDFTYEDVTINGIYISRILSGIDFKTNFLDGEFYPTFEYVNLSGEFTPMILDNLLSYLDYNFTSLDINSNPNLLVDLLKENYTNNIEIDGTGYFEKKGTNYKISYDKGLNNVELENLELTFNKSFTFLDNTYGMSVDLSNIDLRDGVYEVPVNLRFNNESIIKNFTLTLSGIIEEFIPLENETLNIVSKVENLEYGTNIIISLENKTEYTMPTNVNGLEVLNISADKVTSGIINFKINKSLISNKDKVNLYVLESSWTKLATTYLSEDSTYYYFKATTPHFSIFMIGEELTTTSSSSSGSSTKHTKLISQVNQVNEINITQVDYPMLNETKNITLGIDDSEEEEEEKDNTWLWVLGAIVLVVGLIIVVILLVRKE